MSWLQGLAGKAEGLLTRMDQTAASSLHSPGSTDHLNGSSKEFPDGFGAWSRVRRSGSNSSTVSDFSGGYQGQAQTVNETNLNEISIRRTASHQDLDWNSSPRPKHKRNASSKQEDDLLSQLNFPTPEKTNLHASSRPERESSRSNLQSDQNSEKNKPDVSDGAEIEAQKDVLIESATNGSVGASLEAVIRENKLIKSELQGQSRELSMALTRVKRAEQDAQKLLNQLSSEKQRFAAENDTRERDFLTALSAKDSQAALIRVQLEQVELDRKTAEARLAQAKSEIKILEQLSSSYSFREIEEEGSSRRLAEMESQMQKEKEDAVQHIERLKATVRVLEDQNRDYLTKIASLERIRATEQSSLEEVKRQLNLLTVECETAQRELNDYKQKALKILQFKDELINSLKSGNGVVSDEAADLEASEMELERDMLRDEVIKLRESIEKLSKQLGEREAQHKHDCAELRDQCLKAEEIFSAESSRCRELEASVKSYMDELNYVRMESSRKEQSLQQRVKDRDEDLQRTRQQLLTRSESRPTDVELETRMHILSEHLMQKQNAIENLNTEKHAMIVQIERLERRLRETPKTSSIPEARITVASDSADATQTRAPFFLTENSSDNQVARHLKKAYSSVDRFSFRLGIFLRRYPLARIMVIAYMLLLHFWVLVVLLTYTPEIHGDDTPGKK